MSPGEFKQEGFLSDVNPAQLLQIIWEDWAPAFQGGYLEDMHRLTLNGFHSHHSFWLPAVSAILGAYC